MSSSTAVVRMCSATFCAARSEKPISPKGGLTVKQDRSSSNSAAFPLWVSASLTSSSRSDQAASSGKSAPCGSCPSYITSICPRHGKPSRISYTPRYVQGISFFACPSRTSATRRSRSFPIPMRDQTFAASPLNLSSSVPSKALERPLRLKPCAANACKSLSFHTLHKSLTQVSRSREGQPPLLSSVCKQWSSCSRSW